MIKIFIKHYIYDLCIDIIFSKIMRNFDNGDSGKKPRPGDFYSKISSLYQDENYYNNALFKLKNGGGEAGRRTFSPIYSCTQLGPYKAKRRAIKGVFKVKNPRIN